VSSLSSGRMIEVLVQLPGEEYVAIFFGPLPKGCYTFFTEYSHEFSLSDPYVDVWVPERQDEANIVGVHGQFVHGG
jgi:hypothetical protein